MIFTPPCSVLTQLSEAIFGLRDMVARRSVRAGQTIALVLLGYQMLRRMDARLASVWARYKAGRLSSTPQPRSGRPPAKPQPVLTQEEAKAQRARRLPRGFGWYAKLVAPDAYGFAALLSEALAAPELIALMAAGPQAGRSLRTMCQRFGVKPPAAAASAWCGSRVN